MLDAWSTSLGEVEPGDAPKGVHEPWNKIRLTKNAFPCIAIINCYDGREEWQSQPSCVDGDLSAFGSGMLM